MVRIIFFIVLFSINGIEKPASPRSLNKGSNNNRNTHSDSLKTIFSTINWNISASFEGGYIPIGSIKPGFAYDHLIHFSGTLETKPMGLWDGGHLHISVDQITSNQPSLHEIGDLQVASNISARPAFRIYEFTYTQDITSVFSIKIGLIDMNKSFDHSKYGSTLLNSSFGIEPDISANVPVSIYPKPGWGISAVKSFSRQWKLRGCFFQNNPNDRSDLSFHKYMADLEIDYQTSHGISNKPAEFRAGFWHHSPITNHSDGKFQSFSGYYVEAQQTLTNRNVRQTDIFLQWGSSPLKYSDVPYYLGFGLLINHPFSTRSMDRFSLGMAKAWTNKRLSDAETAYEITYMLQINTHISIQPDMQYIQHPSGRLRKDAVVLFLRCSVSLR